MPRPRKWRRVCHIPRNCVFVPLSDDEEQGLGEVVMTVDEFEAIRLIDYEGHNQEECARVMQVARTTVQGIYGEARKKLASSLVEGKKLVIRGGDFRFCEENSHPCPRCKRQMGLCYGNSQDEDESLDCETISKEENNMIIAIPTDEPKKDSPCCISFGRAPYFAFYNQESDSWEFELNTAADAVGAAGIQAAQMILDKGAERLVTFRCGDNAAEVFAGEVEMFKAKNGTAEENIKAFLAGELSPLKEISPGKHGK